MWTCPKCERVFEKTNQDHYCGEPDSCIDDYIAAQPESIQPHLRQVRDTIRGVLPGVQERISWRMPTYWHKNNIFHFAAFKNHIGIYPGEEAMLHFADRLTAYKTSKGALQLPYSKPLPLSLIAEMAKWCNDTNHHH